MSIATLKVLAAQATPGPWSKNIDDERVGAPEIYLNNGYIVAECHGPEKKRNGQLIAAMRNNIDALIAVAEAAQEFVAVQSTAEVDWEAYVALRAALARLEA